MYKRIILLTAYFIQELSCVVTSMAIILCKRNLLSMFSLSICKTSPTRADDVLENIANEI